MVSLYVNDGELVSPGGKHWEGSQAGISYMGRAISPDAGKRVYNRMLSIDRLVSAGDTTGAPTPFSTSTLNRVRILFKSAG